MITRADSPTHTHTVTPEYLISRAPTGSAAASTGKFTDLYIHPFTCNELSPLRSACAGAWVLSQGHESWYMCSSSSQSVPGTAGVSSCQRRMSASAGAKLYHEPQRTWWRHSYLCDWQVTAHLATSSFTKAKASTRCVSSCPGRWRSFKTTRSLPYSVSKLLVDFYRAMLVVQSAVLLL